MAAVLAKGTTVIENAAREPEIVDLCQCLIAMGAEIEGLKTDTLTIHGKDRLHGATHAVMPDRIEAGSYACAAMITGGTLELVGAREDQMHAILSGLDRRRRRADARQDAAITVRARLAAPSRCRCRPRPFRPSRPTCRRNSCRCWRSPTGPAS